MNHFVQNTLNQERAIKHFMRDYSNKTKDGQTMQSILAHAGRYYDADRSYIFEINAQRTKVSNTYEWCQDGVIAKIDNLQNISTEEMEGWLEILEEKGEFCISSLTEEFSPDSETYQLLKPKGIESIAISPLVVKGEAIGFLGVENPRCNKDHLLLLSVISSTCCIEIANKRLENSKKASEERMGIIQSLSEIYTSVYYIDLSSNHFTELSSIADVHTHIGASGDAQERLNYFCHHMVTPEFTEELFEFVDLSTLDARLENTRIISKQYRSTVISSPETGNAAGWGQCSFIEGDRDQEGRLVHVIFATQSVNESKIKELEAQEKLQETNKELAALLAAERQHTAIIDSLSNVFFALYYIDLEENSFQELITLDNMHHMFGEKGDARQSMKQMPDALADEEYRPAMRAFMDIDTVDARLGGKSILIQEYVDLNGGWTRCSFIPVERDENGKNIKVICGFRNITAEKKALESQDNLIRALSMSYENVYAVNMDTGERVCYRMGQTMSDRYRKKFATGKYEQSINSYIENDVFEEDRYLFDNLRSMSGVNELMEDKQSYYFNYRVFRNDEMQYFQCQIVKPNREKNEFALAFKNINEERKKEIAQQTKIEDALEKVEKINEALQDEMEIAGALSKEYPDVSLVNFENDSSVTLKHDGKIIPKDQRVSRYSYSDTWNAYIEKYVLDEDKEKLKDSVYVDVVQHALEDCDEYACSYRVLYEDGSIHHFQATFIRMYSGPKAESKIILGFRNIDAIVEAERKHIKIQETQSEIIEGLGSEYYSVLLVDPEMDTAATYRAEDEDGQAIAEHFRRHNNCWSKGIRSYAEEMVSEDSRSEFLEKLSLGHIREDGEAYSFTYEKLTDRGIMYLQARVSFVREKDGGFVAVVGTRNVDDLIKKERKQEMALQAAFDAAEAANRAKSEFLSNMSHDIRTPMNGIIGMTAIAATHIDDKERVQDSLQKITRASKHLLSLINEVLDMSKIESGKVDLVEEEFCLSDLIDNLLTMTSSQIEEHHHELSVNIAGVAHEAVIGDSLRIQKVFTNLLGNAVKFTPDGGKIRISISERPSNQAKVGCYEFIFEDNGIGMSEEFMDQIFEPFSRSTDGQVRNIQGTGLGMPISRNIVRMMGGDIKVESKLGVGSRFTVTMYLKLQDTTDVHYDKFVDLNVLVADDDALSLESCCGMLNDLGMKAEGVSTGAEAVEHIVIRHEQNRDYFACIIDWKMPDMDGIATTRAIRKAVGKDVPIIIISAYDWTEIELEARAAGANAFISKPLFRSRLAKTFHVLVGEGEGKEQETPFGALENMDLSKYRALLVEDNELNAEIATEILKTTGLMIEHAADGTEAVEKVSGCADGYYDIIFMDIQMPRMNGYDATRAIRAMDRNYCRQVPIVAMTANAFAEDVQAAKTVGMNEHIAKPLDLKVLARTLDKWLG